MRIENLKSVVAASILFFISINAGSQSLNISQIKNNNLDELPLGKFSEKNNTVSDVVLPNKSISEIKELKIEANSISLVSNAKFEIGNKNRGALEVAIYDQIAAGTALIATDSGLGTGVLITDKGHIVTNQHVVGDEKYVTVFFKPINKNKLSKEDSIRGEVIKINVPKDLALIKIAKIPLNARPILLSSGSPKVGEDAHAVGHPRGEYWTYTRGYVSAIREGYEWSGGENGPDHTAKVIQTQTPINPGNSGGPLVSDEKKLIGINSFIAPNNPGLNYAVSVDDVRAFLSQEGSVFGTKKNKVSKDQCGENPANTGTDKDKNGPYEFVAYDTDCVGKIDTVFISPKNKTLPIRIIFDRNRDGKTDLVVFDKDRDERWDFSFIDTDYDGKYDLIGFHPDGKLVPTKFEPYNK
jgi:S1-C subfamily serine protease